MKFVQTGSFKKDYLDEPMKFNPKERVHDILLKKLDYLLGFVAKEKPEIITDYVNNLITKYQGFVEKTILNDLSEVDEKLFIEYQNFNKYPDMKKVSLNYFIHLLQLKDKADWEGTEVEITTRANIEAWTFPSYYLLQTLTETIEREDAIKLYKKYITNFYLDNPSPDRAKFVSLKKRYEDRTSGDTSSSPWVLVHTMLEDGKYAFKNKNCPTCVDSMKDLPDVELKYYTSCYRDYAAFKSYTHDSIILTMEHTLMQGDPYCSRVMHDTRIDYDLRHPPKEFWNNLEPGNEKEAKKYYKK